MKRLLAAVLLGSLAAPAALACGSSAEVEQVCVLTATETITNPKKPNEFTMRLDCGSEPGDMGTTMAKVMGMENTSDAVMAVMGEGFRVASSTTMNAYDGNSIVTTYTMVKMAAASAPAMASGPAPAATAPSEDLEDLEDLDGLE